MTTEVKKTEDVIKPQTEATDVGLTDKKPTLKKIYEGRKTTTSTGTVEGTETVEKVPTQPDIATTGPATIAKVSKGKSLNLAAGGTYPEGVPPGMTKLAWDYDSVTGKYLTGKDKETKRHSIWDTYRKINKGKGVKMSSFGKLLTSMPTKESLKYSSGS